MSRIFDEIRAEAAHECSLEAAERLLADNRFSHEEIAKYTELTLDEIEELARKIAASSKNKQRQFSKNGKLPLFMYMRVTGFLQDS